MSIVLAFLQSFQHRPARLAEELREKPGQLGGPAYCRPVFLFKFFLVADSIMRTG
jgi:hypothetical protein